MKKLPSYLENRTLENNVYANMYSWDAEYQIGNGNCSGCCFRNWRKLCDSMPCHDTQTCINISWDTMHMPQNDAVTLLNHFRDCGGDSVALAAAKRKELFEFLDAGHTLDEWRDKKYNDAWKGMGRT